MAENLAAYKLKLTVELAEERGEALGHVAQHLHENHESWVVSITLLKSELRITNYE